MRVRLAKHTTSRRSATHVRLIVRGLRYTRTYYILLGRGDINIGLTEPSFVEYSSSSSLSHQRSCSSIKSLGLELDLCRASYTFVEKPLEASHLRHRGVYFKKYELIGWSKRFSQNHESGQASTQSVQIGRN